MESSHQRIATLLAAGTFTLVGFASQGSADVVVNDTFTADKNGWTDVAGVTSTVGAGTGPMAGSNVLVATTTAGVNAVARSFTAPTLQNIGDALVVSFDFQLTSAFGSSADYRPAFGLYNSANTATANDDYGYQASFASNAAVGASNARLLHESGGNNAVLAGSDILSIADSSTFPNPAAGDLRRYALTLTRVTVNGDPAIKMDLVVTDPDGVGGNGFPFTLTGTVPSTRFTDTLDRFYLRSNNVHYQLDNFNVTFVPEPSSLALIGAAGVMLLRRRRAD